MARGHHFRAGGSVAKSGDEPDAVEAKGDKKSYTATPNNVEDEAAGEDRKRGGKAKRADGGEVAAHADGGEVAARARGGPAKKHVGMEGEKTKHRRLDRPGRRRGGGVGSTTSPLSSAARVTQAQAHHTDDDGLA